jgi:hypothetical protein
MNINVSYQLRLTNNNIINGSLKTKIGLPIDDFKILVLEKEGFKNHASFTCNEPDVSKVQVNDILGYNIDVQLYLRRE